MSVIGRQPEQDQISAALQALSAGRGSLLLLCGEAGIGKSTLARWAAEQAGDEGLAVHWGVCWEAGGAPAYWPWIQLLRSLLASDASGTLDLLLRGSSVLQHLLPEARPGQAQSQQLQADQVRFQLLEAVRVLMQQAGAGNPALLLLEDLHAADPDTLLMLQDLAPHLNSLPVCVLGTFRDADARLTGSAAPLWQAARGARLMHLQGLDESEIDELLQNITGAGGTTAQLQTLSQRTDGNPFFLTELIQLRVSGFDDDLPDSINEAIRQQLSRLPPATQELLESAAVLGRSFSEDDLLALSGGDIDIPALLEPAKRLDMIQVVDERRPRFSHILYRDVIHHTLEPQRKRDLHLRYGDLLRQRIESGQHHRWQELATHLEQAGPAERMASVEAWRKAGRYARKVGAFEEAVYCQQRALNQFGDGPSADPVERCNLLLEAAETMLVRGEVQAGHDYCREAFRIASVLGDAHLIASAALVLGSTYVAASIDDELIRILQDALSVQPETALADRAQTGARLAAALQPADDPSVPIEMARQAIALARQCGDPEVLLPTLRSAISAMMDTAPAQERRELNEEYIELAHTEGNLAEEFRGYTRLVVDLGVLGLGPEMGSAIAACSRIADDLGLPHYQWRAASARAMQYTIRGDHDAAAEQLDLAAELARQSEDPNALLGLAMQHFALLDIDPGTSSETAGEAVAALEAAMEVNPVAAIYVRPGVLNARHRFKLPVPPGHDISPQRLSKLLGDGDPFALSSMLELAITRGDRELCGTLYGVLLPYAGECSHGGLMGLVWGGPVAYALALAARFLDKPDQLELHLTQARSLAESMGAGPMLEKVSALGAGEVNPVPVESAPSPAGHPLFNLVPDGEMWRVGYGGESALLKDSKGLQILSQLLASPDREIHVLGLVGPAGEVRPTENLDEPALDVQARSAYKARLQELDVELEEAEEFGDMGRSEQAREEMEFIGRELSRAFGLGGRARKSGTDAERARVNVQRRLKDAVKRIGEQIPEAGRYLQGTLDTGTFCRFRPL